MADLASYISLEVVTWRQGPVCLEMDGIRTGIPGATLWPLREDSWRRPLQWLSLWQKSGRPSVIIAIRFVCFPEDVLNTESLRASGRSSSSQIGVLRLWIGVWNCISASFRTSAGYCLFPRPYCLVVNIQQFPEWRLGCMDFFCGMKSGPLVAQMKPQIQRSSKCFFQCVLSTPPSFRRSPSIPAS